MIYKTWHIAYCTDIYLSFHCFTTQDLKKIINQQQELNKYIHQQQEINKYIHQQQEINKHIHQKLEDDKGYSVS